jgi:4-alpha-glucanotransferase
MDLLSQANHLGILTEFTDGQGQRHVTDGAALKIIVDAFPARTPRRFVDGPVVIRTSLPARTELGEGVRLPVHWIIEARGGVVAEGAADDRSLVWPVVEQPALPQRALYRRGERPGLPAAA